MSSISKSNKILDEASREIMRRCPELLKLLLKEGITKMRLRCPTLSEIKYDAPYERDLKESKVQAISKDMHALAIGFLFVSIREGKMWSLDGKHRGHSLMDQQIATWMAIAVWGLTVEGEAKVWEYFNAKHNNPDKKNLLKSRVIRKEKQALEIKRAVEDASFSIPYFKNGSSVEVNGVGALFKAHTRGGKRLLGTVMDTIAIAWGSEDQDAVWSSFISGFAMFLNCESAVDHLDPERVRKMLIKKSPTRLKVMIQTQAHARLKTGASCWAEWLKANYNKGIRKTSRRIMETF